MPARFCGEQKPFLLEGKNTPLQLEFNGNRKGVVSPGGCKREQWPPKTGQPGLGKFLPLGPGGRADSDALLPHPLQTFKSPILHVRSVLPRKELCVPIWDSRPCHGNFSLKINWSSFCFHLSLGSLGRMGLPLDLPLICEVQWQSLQPEPQLLDLRNPSRHDLCLPRTPLGLFCLWNVPRDTWCFLKFF